MLRNESDLIDAIDLCLGELSLLIELKTCGYAVEEAVEKGCGQRLEARDVDQGPRQAAAGTPPHVRYRRLQRQ
ncbi:hypothetical protein [Jiella mangrovi]|uniref:Uncharacterized protein n=1 Tax=Jiella mangrovi TaxID=2821407 RepID=A0ABS4BJC7_9HYPH|nr:hypothetical protein [Jiella mangrovi]MBP0616801.1 hypothetical protein [Jiella mangrovi]